MTTLLSTDHRPPSSAPQPSTPFTPAPPPILTHSPSASTLITQGAEARLYKTTYLLPHLPCALKYRPPKPWRHPILDARLTRQRILAEARILAKCRREGVRVPAVYAVDEGGGWLAMEWVPGAAVRAGLNAHLATGGERDESDAALVSVLRRVAAAVGGLHSVGVVHGDLTTSNMMLAPTPNHQGEEGAGLEGVIVIIDFGLASQSASDEDRAVDLYVLERAFASTHPRAEALFTRVLEAEYGGAFRGAPVVLRKLEEVRLRGRKRSMLG
ncbi:Serine/threonine-protein kinase BUD32 [Camillea tinctor]|nr:Serine/threonine-protein kinase BUD32 [Camillea tinctor]